MSPSTERLAKNQALFREVNERIKEISESRGFVEFLCECSNTDCRESLAVRPDEYDQVRAHSTRFLVAPGHLTPEVETVVDDVQGRFLVVEKTTEREFMAETDPRTRDEV